jgi:DNA polymerase elongation subunit (family B)
MIIDIEPKHSNGRSELYVSYFNKAGDVDYISVPLTDKELFNWVEATGAYEADKDVKTWDNKHVKKLMRSDKKFNFNNPNREFFRLSKYRIEEILSGSPELMEPAHQFNKPKMYFVDIETEITDGFPDAETALNRVLSIAIANDQGKLFVLGLKELSAEKQVAMERNINEYFEKQGVHKKFKTKPWTFSYVKFDSEYEMLYTFFSQLVPKMPCLTGWNFIQYDWMYLVNRCDKIYPKIDPGICSVSGRLTGRNRLPLHRLVVDYLDIYKKWDRVIKIKESNRLDYVAEKAVGVAKVKYNGSLKDLYEKDFFHFIFYNAIDSALIYYIDRRLNTMSTFLSIAHVAQVEINKAFSPIWVMEALMTREFLSMGKVFVEKRDNGLDQAEFEGAYVKQPDIGMHQFVTCYDFASLYPNTMMQFNISPETWRGKGGTAGAGEIKLASGSVFDNSEDSVLRKILKGLYGRRKQTKNKYLQVSKEVDHLKKILETSSHQVIKTES